MLLNHTNTATAEHDVYYLQGAPKKVTPRKILYLWNCSRYMY